MLRITHKVPEPTKEAVALKEALESLGVEVKLEQFDGYKFIDIEIPKARLDVEVDGVHHLTDPHQIIKDLNRGYWSHRDGYSTIHVPNEMVRKHLNGISRALAEASKIREHKIHVRLD